MSKDDQYSCYCIVFMCWLVCELGVGCPILIIDGLNQLLQQMINSYFQSSTSRPPINKNYQQNKFYHEKNLLQAQQKRYKLFILIIARATARTIKSSFQILHQNTKVVPQAIAKMVALSEKNINLTVFLAFQKVRVVAVGKRRDDNAIKNIVILLQRMEKYKVKQAFSKIILHCLRLDKKFIQSFYSQRTHQFGRKINALFKRKKKTVLQAIINWAHFIKSFSKLRVILVIRGRIQRQAKQTFFSRINRFLLKKTSKHITDQEISELKTQLQDMNVQLQNKNQNIQRLQTQISQFKVDQSSQSLNNVSYGEYNNNKSKAHSVKKFSFNERSIAKLSRNQSYDNISLNDLSIGSILGNLNKSRTDSASKFEQSGDCSCGFKPKYKKYRNLYDSLKNQLQIVKEQLEVAKDLNQHFTNQIKQFLSGDSNQGDFQKLKRQYELLLQDRDQLRQKVFKYQKHINNLKAQFKVKMQELYRKVRKDM